MSARSPRRLIALLMMPLCLALTSGQVFAEKADRDKPTTIDSDRLSHDDQKQITTFSGNVVLTKGTLQMRGDKLELWQDANGNYFGVMTGRPARFRQKRDGVNEFMEGESSRMDYNGKEETVMLSGNAIMRRLGGDQLKDQVSGDRLTYNNLTERYLVESGEGQPRSRMFLMPKSEGRTP
ncbi:MAG: lipopolysaccharide transport periplasmic protein LptA [Pseudomonadota bacterium]|jgi:lipopolysaccharide export system protein LptA